MNFLIVCSLFLTLLTSCCLNYTEPNYVYILHEVSLKNKETSLNVEPINKSCDCTCINSFDETIQSQNSI